ncbi:MAG: cytochrome c oxidase subunit 3 [Actinobacteria bacterium]|nr:cytochrome c oxidase subunit 3 [Actinomycetota bacterium]
MIELPAAPLPAPRRQVFVGTAVVCAAAISLLGGMLALYLRLRDQAIDTDGVWLPDGVSIPMVPANVMLIAMLPIGVFAQWAVYSAKRGDRVHTATALGLVALLAVAVINAQANIYVRMNVPAVGGTFNTMFYSLTGVVMALFIAGVVFTSVTAFRYLGGRTADREIVSAHALYWYFLSFALAMLWFVIYVTK